MWKKAQSTRTVLEHVAGDIKDMVVEGWNKGAFKLSKDCDHEHSNEFHEMRHKVRKLERQLMVAEAARSEFYGELGDCRARITLTKPRAKIPKELLDCPANLTSANAEIARLEQDCGMASARPWTPGWRGNFGRERLRRRLPAMLLVSLLGLLVCCAMWSEWWGSLRDAWPSWRKARALTEVISRLRWKVRALEDTIEQLRSQLDAELGDTITVDRGNAPTPLRSEFSFTTFDAQSGQDIVRTVKIQVPGVDKRDVCVRIIHNGCTVAIERKGAPGVEAILWTRTFKFRQSEGYFEFKEDEASLERGYLQLVFHGTTSHERIFRFPTEPAAEYDAPWNLEAFKTKVMAQSRHPRKAAAVAMESTALPQLLMPSRPTPTEALTMKAVVSGMVPQPVEDANDIGSDEAPVPAGGAEGTAMSDVGSDEAPVTEAPSGAPAMAQDINLLEAPDVGGEACGGARDGGSEATLGSEWLRPEPPSAGSDFEKVDESI